MVGIYWSGDNRVIMWLYKNSVLGMRNFFKLCVSCIAIFHRSDNDEKNRWVERGAGYFQTNPVGSNGGSTVKLLGKHLQIWSKDYFFCGGQHDKMVVKVITSGSSLDSIFDLGGCRVCVFFFMFLMGKTIFMEKWCVYKPQLNMEGKQTMNI